MIRHLNIIHDMRRNIAHGLGTEEKVQRPFGPDRWEGRRMGVDDFKIARFRQSIQFAGASEDIESSAENNITASGEHLLDLPALQPARIAAKREVHEQERHAIAKLNVVDQLLAAMLEVTLPELQGVMTEEPVAVIAEERQKPKHAEASILVIDVRRVRVWVGHKTMLAMNFNEATEIGVFAIEESVDGLTHFTNNPPRRV